MPAEPLGTVIAKRRHVLGFSQEELAARVGVSRDSVSAWERGKHFPHRHLGKLEQVLGVSLTADGLAPEPPADPRERELYYLLLERIEHMTHAEALAVIGDARRRRAERRSA